MSEENTPNSQEENFAALRAQKEALEAELRPLKVEKAVTSAGFDPTTPEGKALTRLALAESDVDAEKVKSLAEELGFDNTPPPAPKLNQTEQAMAQLADRQAQLGSVTTPDDSANRDEIAEVQAALNAARENGDWVATKALSQKLIRLGSGKIFTQVMARD